MKHSNLYKIVSVVMVVAMLMLSATGVFAQTTAVQDDISTNVITVSGTIESDAYDSLTVVVLKPGVTEETANAAIEAGDVWNSNLFIGARTDILPSEGGAFSVDITLPDGAENAPRGTYTVVVAAKHGPKETASVYFASISERIAAVREVVTAESDTVCVEKINEYAELLDLDANLWALLPEADKTAAAGRILSDSLVVELRANPDSIAVDDVPEVSNTINGEALVGALNNSLVTDLAPYLDHFDAEGYMQEYEAVSDAGRAAILTNISGKGFANKTEMNDAFIEKVKLAGISYPSVGGANSAKQVLQKYASSFGMDLTRFNGLTQLQQNTVMTEVVAAHPMTVDALKTVFNTAMSKIATPTPTRTPGGSTGGGGGITVRPTPTVTPTPAGVDFEDIDNILWAKDQIIALAEKGVLSGDGNGYFRPDDNILREEFTKVVVCGVYGSGVVEEGTVPSFTDAQTGWYAPYLAAAERLNVTAGMGDGTFGVGQQITRQDMALMLYRTLVDEGVAVDSTPSSFTDSDAIAEYARDAVYALKNLGVINGYEDGSFGPERPATRAETAVMFYNTLSHMNKL